MTAAEARALIAKGTSDFTGNGAIEYYTGFGDPSLQFNGSEGASLLDTGEGAEPFILTVVNANSSARTFYLSMGYLYTRGSESAGQLKTGTFAAANDEGTATSLTASASNAVSIEQFIAYTRNNPTYVPLIQLTTSSSTAQLATSIQHYRQGMIKNESPITIPLRKQADGNQYNLQFQDVKEPLFLSQQDVIAIQVAGSSTLTLNLYPLVSKSQRSELKGDIQLAQQVFDSNPQAVMAQDKVVKNAVARIGAFTRV